MGSKDVRIRIATPKDAGGLLKIYAPYVEKTAITFEYEVPSVEEFAMRIETVLRRYPYLAAEKGGELLGYAYAGAFHGRAAYGWAVETSIYVAQDKKKMGIGRQLHDMLEMALKSQGILNMNACVACPREEKDPYLSRNSVEFHRHLGYRLVGEFWQCGYKFGRWYNMAWLEKHIGGHHKGQPAPRAFSEVQGRTGGGLYGPDGAIWADGAANR